MKMIKWLDDHIEEVFIVFFTLLMIVSIALQVFMRYVMNNSLSWSEELARYCFIWLIYTGISLAVKKQKHMRVDAIFMFVKGKGEIILGMIGNLLFLLFALFAIAYGSEITIKILTWGQASPAINLPMWLVYLAEPVGMGLTVIRLIQLLVQQFKQLNKQAVE